MVDELLLGDEHPKNQDIQIFDIFIHFLACWQLLTTSTCDTNLGFENPNVGVPDQKPIPGHVGDTDR